MKGVGGRLHNDSKVGLGGSAQIGGINRNLVRRSLSDIGKGLSSQSQGGIA